MLHRLAARLMVNFTLPSDVVVHTEIAKFFRRNFLVNIVDMMLWTAGASFIAPRTILPVYASHLTSSAILIGLIPGLLDFGAFAPPLLITPLVERMSRKYRLVVVLGAVERVPYVLLPLAVIWFDKIPHNLAIWCLLAFVAWMSFGTGFVLTPWQEMLAKLIPVSHRGRLFGIGFFLGGLMSMAATPLVAAILAGFPYPRNYAVSFSVASIGIVGSLVFLALNREPSIPPVPQPEHLPQSGYLNRLRVILATHHNFRGYLLSQWLIQFGRMPFAFMTLYAVHRFDFPDNSAAIFSGVLYAMGMIGYVVWGDIGDKWGHKRVLELSVAIWILALVLAPLAVYWSAILYPVFACMGFSDSGYLISSLNLPLEFGSEADRPTIISLTRTIIGPALLLVPLLGGSLIETWGYHALFLVSLGLAGIGWAILVFRVAEPRGNRYELSVQEL